MLQKKIFPIVVSLWLSSCTEAQEEMSFQVEEWRTANFSVIGPELFPQEKLLVKVNGEVLLEAGNDTSFTYPISTYFLYPDSIRVVEVSTFHKGKEKQNRVFSDTLKNATSRSVLLSRPFPVGVNQPEKPVPIESGVRRITLVDDAVLSKDTWRD